MGRGGRQGRRGRRARDVKDAQDVQDVEHVKDVMGLADLGRDLFRCQQAHPQKIQIMFAVLGEALFRISFFWLSVVRLYWRHLANWHGRQSSAARTPFSRKVW